ncbi:glycine zipper 2TM domain-containing protein [Piscinibacterium candidicorallinum]|uniref:Glycine zipper 2TM domain-containing protein n=1 Tax=Piscinibacterium candidicorallinum TaxID=1793872 RepID=A0ABV7H5K3_9BURK
MTVQSNLARAKPRINRKLVAVSLLAAALLASGCATSSNSASVYSANQTQREYTVRMAVVESVREVSIERQQTGLGTGAGAIVGGIAGSSIGGRRENIAGAVLGAVAGGVIGQAVEGAGNRRKGVEILLRYPNGDLRAIVQEDDGQGLKAGDTVRVMQSGGVTRVVRG